MTRRRMLGAAVGLAVYGPPAVRAARAGQAVQAVPGEAVPGAAGAAGAAEAAGESAGGQVDDIRPAALLQSLRAGGCVLVMRHAATDPGVGDPPGFRLGDCATQRNLSLAGQAQSRRFGARLARAGVPVGPVRSSRWCRCLDTARLAFGRVDPWLQLDSFFDDRDAEAARTAQVLAWIQSFGGVGNAVLVTHQVNATALAGGWLAMGEALVLKASDGAPRLLGRLPG